MFKLDRLIVFLNVVPIPSTPITLVLLPLPVISAHLSVPKSPHVEPEGIEAGPCPPQSKSISPSLLEETNPEPEESISPESLLVTVVVVVTEVVVSIVVMPVESVKLSVTISDSIDTSTAGSHSPTVSTTHVWLTAFCTLKNKQHKQHANNAFLWVNLNRCFTFYSLSWFWCV